MRNHKHVFLIPLILISLCTILNVATVSGEVITRLYFDPDLNVALVGETFNVTVKVGNVRDLFSWQVVMSFNPVVLEAIDVTISDFLATQPQGTFQPPPVLNNTYGWVGFGETSLGRQPGVDGSGILGIVTFRVETAGESFLNITDPVPRTLTVNATTKLLDSSWPVPRKIPFTPEDGTFVIGAKPVALFTYSPSSPEINQMITFNASASYDPDGTITSYDWDFGDGSNDTGVIVQHTFTAGGTYPVTLNVTDDSLFQLEGVLTKDVVIRFGIDVAVTNVVTSQKSVKAGKTMSINVTVENQGVETATFDVTIYYTLTQEEAEDHVAGTLTFTDLLPGTNQILTLDWDTSGVDSGDYRIKAVAATLEGETDTDDNTFIDGTVTVEASGSAFPLEYAIVGVVAVVVIVGAAFLYTRRKSS